MFHVWRTFFVRRIVLCAHDLLASPRDTSILIPISLLVFLVTAFLASLLCSMHELSPPLRTAHVKTLHICIDVYCCLILLCDTSLHTSPVSALLFHGLASAYPVDLRILPHTPVPSHSSRIPPHCQYSPVVSTHPPPFPLTRSMHGSTVFRYIPCQVGWCSPPPRSPSMHVRSPHTDSRSSTYVIPRFTRRPMSIICVSCFVLYDNGVARRRTENAI